MMIILPKKRPFFRVYDLHVTYSVWNREFPDRELPGNFGFWNSRFPGSSFRDPGNPIYSLVSAFFLEIFEFARQFSSNCLEL